MNNKLLFTNCLLLYAFSGACFGAQRDCSANDDCLSPYAASVLHAQGTQSQRLFTLEGLNVWLMQPANQQAELVFTTPSGLLLRGSMVGPDGEDIAAALSLTMRAKRLADESPQRGRERSVPPDAIGQAASGISAQTQPAPESPDNGAAIPTFATLKQLRSQADTYLMWIEANHAAPEAPVLYMFTDPLCSFCSRSLRVLKPSVDRGALALRLVPTPILSPLSFELAISFVEDRNPGNAFIQHALQTADGQPSQVLPRPLDKVDKAVIDAMARNLQWFRRNGLQGVPFFLYRSGTDDQVFYGQIDDSRIDMILQGDHMREGDSLDP
ncbi:thioredoxin fold domain-containing protein [Brucella pseudogrignonensis]|jgi:thiol:disulfide interchange protein DsbG